METCARPNEWRAVTWDRNTHTHNGTAFTWIRRQLYCRRWAPICFHFISGQERTATEIDQKKLIICDPPWNEFGCYLHASAFRLLLNGALKRGEIINVLLTNERRWATGDKKWIVFVSRKRTSQFIMTFWRTPSRFRANEHEQLTTAKNTFLSHKWSGPSFRWVSNGRK